VPIIKSMERKPFKLYFFVMKLAEIFNNISKIFLQRGHKNNDLSLYSYIHIYIMQIELINVRE